MENIRQDYLILLNIKKNNLKYKKDITLVDEHDDPGLFSLNIYSDNSGLQVYDINLKKYIDVKENHGIIFCGRKAYECSNKKIPSVKHRVINNTEGRFSIWYELADNFQIPKLKYIKHNELSDEEELIKNKQYFSRLLPLSNIRELDIYETHSPPPDYMNYSNLDQPSELVDYNS